MAQTPAQKREWYLANRERHLARTKVRHTAKRTAVRDHIQEYKRSHPCVDCGESDPIVLDFDHIEKKSFHICQAAELLKSVGALKEEIAKCVVRCSNCHRRKTHQTNAYRSWRLP